MVENNNAQTPHAEQFRQVLLWPVQLIPTANTHQIQKYWETMRTQAAGSPWREMSDEFASENKQLSEARYQEFVTFLPFAQRFLYGEGKRGGLGGEHEDSPIHIFFRHDVAKVRITIDETKAPIVLSVAHTELFFFYDIDIAVLSVEIVGSKIELASAMELLFRFGRTYPSYWDKHGHAGNCVQKVAWLDKNDAVLSQSDYEDKQRYLDFVKNNHVPNVASHWAFLIHPLVQHYSDEQGLIRYREIEYQRMPLMSYLSFDDITQLSRGDLIRLGLLAPYWDSSTLPYPTEFLNDFEKKHCYDRYWDGAQLDHWNNTRFMCSEQGLVVVGSQQHPFYTDENMGTLSQFKNQFFLLFLIAHFQKAALLMISDRLVQAISHLDIDNAESVKNFRLSIRHTMEVFLRFTHRYWFQEVSDQALARDLFHMMHQHINSDKLFEKTRRRIMDMQEYLENEELRRQADTVVRLTVVTILGLVGTMTSGLLGMNLIDLTTQSLSVKLLCFVAVFIPVTALTFYTVAKSKRLSLFLDAMSDEKIQSINKLKTLLNVWSNKSDNEN
ncbi:MAG TPA: hypothetical protein VGJ90_01285 [Methylophilaceae bacterium]|jgi:hypothetical protein